MNENEIYYAYEMIYDKADVPESNIESASGLTSHILRII